MKMERLTVAEISAKWLAARQPRWKPQTYSAAETHVKKYIEPKLGHLKATGCKTVDVEMAGAEWEKTVSHVTVNKVLTTLAAIYKFAKKLGIKNNPVADVERLRNKTTPEPFEALALGEIADHGTDAPEQKPGTLRAIDPSEVYSASELRKILEGAQPVFEIAFLLTAVFCGLRHGEIAGLRWTGSI